MVLIASVISSSAAQLAQGRAVRRRRRCLRMLSGLAMNDGLNGQLAYMHCIGYFAVTEWLLWANGGQKAPGLSIKFEHCLKCTNVFAS